ncbi:hypothetical protein FACS1894147_05720 [Spirochaetia bacterium]|nr:hypothetical protein FACS1894147_05720 [Spirochaetia bacterium]
MLFFYHFFTSNIIIINTTLSPFIPKRKGQAIIETWHGGGAYKKVGTSVARNKFDTYKGMISGSNVDYYLSSSEKFTEVQSEAKCVSKDKFINIGMPRNDILINTNINLGYKIRDKLNVSEKNSKIVLYAPTFRGKVSNGEFYKNELLNNIYEFNQFLSNVFGGCWYFFIRQHYYVNKRIRNNTIIDVSDYDDMQELLLAADVLITDYSSCMWDFALTGKPGFLYMEDILQYKEERDFYTPIESWPYPHAASYTELKKLISNYDENESLKRIKEHFKLLNSYETGTAAKQISDLIKILSNR